MLNLSTDILKQLRNAICRPEGTIEFKYSSDSLFDPNDPGAVSYTHLDVYKRQILLRYAKLFPSTWRIGETSSHWIFRLQAACLKDLMGNLLVR